jgi:hypothetical protein
MRFAQSGLVAADKNHMTITRSIRLMSMTFAVAVASTWLAPAALAGPLDGVQNTTSDAVNGTTNAVSNVTDPVVDTVTGTTGGATNTVTETSGGVTNTVTETTGGATNPVSDVVDSVNESAGGNPGGVVDQAKDTVHGVSTGATSDLGSTVHNPLGGAGNGGVGSLLQDPGLIDQKDQSNVPGSAGGTIHGHTVDAASET